MGGHGEAWGGIGGHGGAWGGIRAWGHGFFMPKRVIKLQNGHIYEYGHD